MSSDPHDNPQGPGDARPTALQVIEREHAADRLKGKVVLLTGATSGIGTETAKALAHAGAHLYLPVRDLAAGSALIADIQATLPNTQETQIQLLSINLNSLESVRKCAQEFLKKSKQLHILINNAGVMSTPEGRTADGFETQFGTNHLAHFLLFQLLKPTLLASSTSNFHCRVICLSSSAHNLSPILFDDYDQKKIGYDKWRSYGQSKTANLYMAIEIERRYGNQGLHAWAVHPGGILTNLQKHMQQEEKEKFFYTDGALNKRFKSVEQGAATTVWAATAAELEGKGGKYLENISICEQPNVPPDRTRGYAPWAYDSEAAQRLWRESLKMVGLPEED